MRTIRKFFTGLFNTKSQPKIKKDKYIPSKKEVPVIKERKRVKANKSDKKLKRIRRKAWHHERLKNETYEQYRSRRKHQQVLNKRSWVLFWPSNHRNAGTYTIKKNGPIKERINQPQKSK